MISPYFMNVDPSPTKLRMFFGRRQEIRTLRDYLTNGDSVLIVGERRIGKTFLLYMICDLAQRGSEAYQRLLDAQTGGLLAELHAAVAPFRWLYLDMLSVDTSAGFYANILVGLGGEKAEHFLSMYPIDHGTFLRELTGLSKELSTRNQRAVILVDETEKLLRLDNCAQILSVLKAVVQQCDSIDLVLAGDLRSHYETPDFVNLKTTLRPIYLGPLEPTDALALIQVPVQGQLSFDEQVLQRILELTGCRPGLVQILCDHLYESVVRQASAPHHISIAEFDQLWESGLRERIFDTFEPVLRDFFEGLQGNERDILVFVAHNPGATESAVAETLALDIAQARRSLRSLAVAHRLVRAGDGYVIGAGIVEEFGVGFISLPAGSSVTSGEVGIVMPVTVKDIIRREEGSDLELKSSLRWDYNRKAVHEDIQNSALKTIAAFLNSNGGTLVIGVSDAGQVLGLKPDYQSFKKRDRDGFQLFLMTAISESMGKGVCTLVHPSFESIDGLDVCIVRVEPSPFAVYAGKDTIFYIRTGNQTQSLNSKEVVEYIRYHPWPSP